MKGALRFMPTMPAVWPRIRLVLAKVILAVVPLGNATAVTRMSRRTFELSST